jgi:hypothetical protein
MPENAPKKYRLSFVNAAEDVPRLVRAYGKACDGEFAMVLRPAEQRGLLVLVTKEGARFWRAPTSPVETSDAPSMPALETSAKDAVALVKAEQKAVPKPGPITLRGQWSGTVSCDDGAPRVELVRKLAAYGVLTITSSPTGWSWSVARAEKWFSKPGSDVGAAPTLVGAIEAGLARAMGLLGEACSVRDSRRRAALDTGYAVEHPIQPAKEGRDPTDRFDPKEPKPRKKPPAAGGWTHYPHDDEAPESDPIDRPTKAVLAAVKAGGLTHDAGAGTFLGRTIEAFHGFPAGSLVFRQPEDNAGFYLHVPLETAPKKPRPPKKPPAVVPAPGLAAPDPAPDVDAAKDKALIDAFSAAVAAALEQSK